MGFSCPSFGLLHIVTNASCGQYYCDIAADPNLNMSTCQSSINCSNIEQYQQLQPNSDISGPGVSSIATN